LAEYINMVEYTGNCFKQFTEIKSSLYSIYVKTDQSLDVKAALQLLLSTKNKKSHLGRVSTKAFLAS